MSYRQAKKSLISKAVLSVLAGCAAGSALPQARPDAGQTLREMERSTPAQPSPSMPAPPLTTPSEPAATVAPDTTRIGIVKGFKITGVISIPLEELTALVAPWVYRDLTLAGLKEAAEAITRLYRERGFPVARAFIPVQTMHDSVVEIAVLEGRLGGISLKNSSRLSDTRVQALASQAKQGDAVNGAVLERGLLLLQDTPGIGAVIAALQPGATVGSTDMVLSVEGGPLVSGSVDVDNAGNRFTGSNRMGATVNLNSPFGIGDQLGLRMQVTDEKLLYGRVSYRVPVGANGLMAGVGFSNSRYQLGGVFEPLDANGTARAANVFVTYPFIRSRAFNLSGSLSGESKSLEDRIDSTSSVTDKSLQQLTASLVASGPFAGGGGYSAAAAVSAGNLDIKTPTALLIDDATARSHGSFSKIAYSLSGVMPLAGSWSLLALANGQIASKNLDSSEKFSLGGADGVRAYPQGEAIGDDGYLLTAEVRYALPSPGRGIMQVGGFADYGMVKINHNPFIAGENTRHLSAIGLSFNWVMPNNFLVKASIARKLGNASATSDTDRGVRAWIQGVKSFDGF
ncbi:MAG: ShlB/FhaC/HecB family hemolysin secretion/activation protein [Herminiimonas sp.]|nr:ShlB/FhaC/HecB family hemolysin secretion/activation protein [Herminiimonas sp.]